MVPQVSLAPQFLSARLIEPVGQFKDLVHEEGEHIQEEEVEREVILSMTAIVFYAASMVLRRIEDLIFYLPSAPSDARQFFSICFLCHDVRDPAIIAGSLAFLVIKTVSEVVD
jgi:hypothetical protein